MHADIVNGYFPLKGGQWLPMFADIANLRDMHGLRFRAAASVEGMVKAKLFAGMDEDTLIPSEITKRPCNDIRQALADYTSVLTHIETSPPLQADKESSCYICHRGAKCVCLDGTTALASQKNISKTSFDDGPDERNHEYLASDADVMNMSRVCIHMSQI